MEKRFCEIIKIIKLAITINVLLLFQACSNSNNSTQEEITIPLIIEAGTRCVPVKINNKSQVLMDCGKLFYAIWSKDEGFKKLPPPPKIFAEFPANVPITLEQEGFSDDGKVLFLPHSFRDEDLLLPQDSYLLLPQDSYLFDGDEYIKLENSYYTAISDNGEYLAGLPINGDPLLLHNLNSVIVAPFPAHVEITGFVGGVNNKGQAVASASYSDDAHTFSAIYGVSFSEAESKILPPPVRPDRNYSFANAINANGDIVLEISSPIDPQHPNGLSKVLILHPDLSFQEVFPEAVGFHVSGITVNDHNSVNFNDRNVLPISAGEYFNQDFFIALSDGKVVKLRDIVTNGDDISINFTPYDINNLNELLVAINYYDHNGNLNTSEYKIIKLP